MITNAIRKYIHIKIMYINIGTPKIINFSFVPNRKFIILHIPKFRHIRVMHFNIINFTLNLLTLKSFCAQK